MYTKSVNSYSKQYSIKREHELLQTEIYKLLYIFLLWYNSECQMFWSSNDIHFQQRCCFKQMINWTDAVHNAAIYMGHNVTRSQTSTKNIKLLTVERLKYKLIFIILYSFCSTVIMMRLCHQVTRNSFLSTCQWYIVYEKANENNNYWKVFKKKNSGIGTIAQIKTAIS